MEQHNDYLLLKSRSAGACIKAGVSLYLSNFRKIFRQTWIAALLWAVASVVVGTISVTTFPQIMAFASAPAGGDVASWLVTMEIVYAILSVIGLTALVLLIGTGLAVLSQHAGQGAISQPTRIFAFDRTIIWRTIKAAVLLVVLEIVVCICLSLLMVALMMLMGRGAGLGLAVVIFLIVAILLLPIEYVLIKYVISRSGSLARHLSDGYPRGLRHLGLIFLVMLVTEILVMLVMLVIGLPAFILASANIMAYGGTLIGDPLGMPGYILVLTGVTMCISGFIQAYVLLMALFPAYYMYGSIEQQETERIEAIRAIGKQQ